MSVRPNHDRAASHVAPESRLRIVGTEELDSLDLIRGQALERFEITVRDLVQIHDCIYGVRLAQRLRAVRTKEIWAEP